MTNLVFIIRSLLVIQLFISVSECRKSKRISTLTRRKSYLIPLKTKFILKCSSLDYLKGENDVHNDDQFDEQQPELIVLNNLEQAGKLVEHFDKIENEKFEPKVEIIGWNKTSLSRLFAGRSRKAGGDKRREKPSDKVIENMFRSDIFDSNALGGLTSLIGLNDANGDLEEATQFEHHLNIDDKTLQNLNPSNNIPFVEKLLYVTCILTWPFTQECHLVKQFKLTVDRPNKSSLDYWEDLNSHDRLRLKKLLKQLMKYCQPVSSSTSGIPVKSNKPKKEKKTQSESEENDLFVCRIFKVLFNDLFIHVFLDIINVVFSTLFDYLFSNVFSSTIYHFFMSTLGELVNDLVNELFVDLIKEFNLIYIIYILFIIFIYNAFNSSQHQTSKQARIKTYKIDSSFLGKSKDSDDDRMLRPEMYQNLHKNDRKMSNEHETSISPHVRPDHNLKFNLDASVTNRAGKNLMDRIMGARTCASSMPFRTNIENLKDADKFKNLFSDKCADDLINKQKSGELDELKEFRRDPGRTLIDSKKPIEDLQMKGEIAYSKQGKVSYLSKFLFNIPKELEDEQKPLQLIFDASNPNVMKKVISVEKNVLSDLDDKQDEQVKNQNSGYERDDEKSDGNGENGESNENVQSDVHESHENDENTETTDEYSDSQETHNVDLPLESSFSNDLSHESSNR